MINEGNIYKMKTNKLTPLLFWLIVIVCDLLNSSTDPGEITGYQYQQPIQLDDGWQTSTPEAEDVDFKVLKNMLDTIQDQGYDFLKGIVVAKNGKLIFEEYFNQTNINSMSHIQSATKSITSALIGIAIDKGFIEDIDSFLFPYFPEYDHLRDPDKDKITLKHVITMTPGFAWNEVSTNVIGDENDNVIGHNRNYIEYVLSKTVVHEPGAYWYYNSGCPVL